MWTKTGKKDGQKNLFRTKFGIKWRWPFARFDDATFEATLFCCRQNLTYRKLIFQPNILTAENVLSMMRHNFDDLFFPWTNFLIGYGRPP